MKSLAAPSPINALHRKSIDPPRLPSSPCHGTQPIRSDLLRRRSESLETLATRHIVAVGRSNYISVREQIRSSQFPRLDFHRRRKIERKRERERGGKSQSSREHSGRVRVKFNFLGARSPREVIENLPDATRQQNNRYSGAPSLRAEIGASCTPASPWFRGARLAPDTIPIRIPRPRRIKRYTICPGNGVLASSTADIASTRRSDRRNATQAPASWNLDLSPLGNAISSGGVERIAASRTFSANFN